MDDEDLQAMFASKKKKKKDKKQGQVQEEQEDPMDSYDELLRRIYEQMGQVQEQRFGMKLKPPKTERIGSKKTAWINFRETAETMNRSEDHLSLFISSETGTLTSITQDGALLIRGIFPSMKLESCLKKYIEHYVKCGMCRALQTTLKKDAETRVNVMSCERCYATRSVANIVVGFHATTKADRKKQLEE